MFDILWILCDLLYLLIYFTIDSFVKASAIFLLTFARGAMWGPSFQKEMSSWLDTPLGALVMGVKIKKSNVIDGAAVRKYIP